MPQDSSMLCTVVPQTGNYVNIHPKETQQVNLCPWRGSFWQSTVSTQWRTVWLFSEKLPS